VQSVDQADRAFISITVIFLITICCHIIATSLI
jgi:hypothetical protein